MPRVVYCFLFFVSLFFLVPAPAMAAGLSFTAIPQSVKSGETTTVHVLVSPEPVSLNILQAGILFDTASLSVLSCTVNEQFKGIAGQSACLVGNGTVRIQIESTSVRGPTQQIVVATLSVRLTGANGTLSLGPGGQIVGQNTQGESQLLPLSTSIPITIGENRGATQKQSPAEGNAPLPLKVTVPPAPETKGFLGTIFSWFRGLFSS